jgi:hypothetical protein
MLSLGFLDAWGRRQEMKPVPSYQHPQENPIGAMVHTLIGGDRQQQL